jgi:ketosteroid isomerase-like protein
MKIRSVVTLVGLAISFALPTFGQQKDTADPRIVQQHDLLGVAKALDEFGELNQGLDDAYNRNDAAAAAALFTEDALLVAPDGMFSGRQHIEERYADTFQRSPIVNFNCSWDRRHLNAIDNAVWSAGPWFGTFQSQAGPVFASGYWSAIYVREGDAWKIRMLTLNEQPGPAPRAETKWKIRGEAPD